MRNLRTPSLHLLTVGLLATAIPLTAAATPSGSCEAPEGGEVVADAHEADVSGGTAPLVTYAGHLYAMDLRDTGEEPADVEVTITWDYTSDWDLSVYDADGNELGEGSIGDQLVGGEEPQETVLVELEHCQTFEVRVENFLADSTSTVQLRIDVG